MNNNKNPILEAVGVGLAGAAVGLGLALMIGELFEEVAQKPRKTPTKSAEERVDWAELGRSMLAQPAKAGHSLSDHLMHQYVGLYLIGRSGKKLNPSEVESICKDLHHFHKQLDRETDWGPAAWYETMGTSHKIPLSYRLSQCPEIIELGVDDGYIAYALGEKIDDLEFGDFLSDFTALQNRGLLD